MEAIVESTGGEAVAGGAEGGPIPEPLRRAIAVYEAGKALIAYVTPDYEEIARVRGAVAFLRVGFVPCRSNRRHLPALGTACTGRCAHAIGFS